jgi:putative endonuclease
MGGWAYIMASSRNGTLYAGVTSDLHRRAAEHKLGEVQGFTKRYGCKTPVWYERHHDIETTIQREKSIKRYRRIWKLRLIETFNPDWDDLHEICQDRDNLFEPAFVKRFEEDWSQLDPARPSSRSTAQSSSSGSGPRIQTAPRSRFGSDAQEHDQKQSSVRAQSRPHGACWILGPVAEDDETRERAAQRSSPAAGEPASLAPTPTSPSGSGPRIQTAPRSRFGSDAQEHDQEQSSVRAQSRPHGAGWILGPVAEDGDRRAR